MASEATFLMQQFLRWVEERPRRPAELREAWSSTCPLNCAWEDAIADDLVGYDRDGRLVLSARGRARVTANPKACLDPAPLASIVAGNSAPRPTPPFEGESP